MTYILSFIVAFGVAAIVGQLLIPLLRRLKAGQSIRADGPTWHMSKQGTPTMGGIMFILAIGAAVVVAGWDDLMHGDCNHLYVFLFALVFGAIGIIDDFQKLRHHANEGLTAAQKFLLQLAAAIAFTVLMREQGYLTPNLFVPFLGVEIILPWVVYMVFAAFVMVGTVNAVNLTDGIDGLATGVTIPVALFYMAVSAWFGKNDLAILSAALAGGLAAFLLYNFHPAKVFMGDTGSLFLGGMVCGLAFALDIPLVIPIIGLVYVAEVLSDIIQVVYFKKTHGKRFFRMAPLHHHLEMGGWSETKLFCIFSGATLLLCVLGFFGVMYRYPM
ncbi:phospho-N-acetylmuramoyl-pentapeptide-transferase [Oscillospiraceae bacterium 44-34]